MADDESNEQNLQLELEFYQVHYSNLLRFLGSTEIATGADSNDADNGLSRLFTGVSEEDFVIKLDEKDLKAIEDEYRFSSAAGGGSCENSTLDLRKIRFDLQTVDEVCDSEKGIKAELSLKAQKDISRYQNTSKLVITVFSDQLNDKSLLLIVNDNALIFDRQPESISGQLLYMADSDEFSTNDGLKSSTWTLVAKDSARMGRGREPRRKTNIV